MTGRSADAPLVVIPCGGRKVTWPDQARRLYIGSYFTACLRWARSITVPEKVFILSAKHGLLALDDQVAPYDLRMGQPGAVTAETVRRQARNRGILTEPDVRLAMGRAYAKVALQVWPHATNILAGSAGIGAQMQTLGYATRYCTPAGETATVTS